MKLDGRLACWEYFGANHYLCSICLRVLKNTWYLDGKIKKKKKEQQQKKPFQFWFSHYRDASFSDPKVFISVNNSPAHGLIVF